LLRNEKDIGKVYNEGLHIETKAAVTRERLEALRKNWDFDRVLKEGGFSRAVSAATSVAASGAGENCGCQKTFFASSGVATIRAMATHGGMVISFSGDRNSSGVFRLRSAGASLRSR
jgi:hypothetical protein